MNDILALPRLAELVAALVPCQHEESEKFIKAFFAHIEDALAVSDEVTINGLGTFIRNSDPDNPVVFKPSVSISEALNQPFEMFEPVAVGDADFTPDTETDEKEYSDIDPVELIANKDIDDEEPSADQNETLNVEPDFNSDNSDTDVTNIIITPENEIIEIDLPEDSTPIPSPAFADEPDADYVSETVKRPKIAPWLILTFVLGLLSGALMSYFGHDKINALLAPPSQESSEDIKPAEIEIVDTIEETDSIITPETSTVDSLQVVIPEEAEHVIVYDTVTPDRFLTTMARQYYGQMEYWVFIYEANAGELGNPNRIKPGTRVTIPDKSEFSRDETPEQTLARAKRMSKEIYERY